MSVYDFCVDIDNVIARTDEVIREIIFKYTNGRVNFTYEDICQFNYFECSDVERNSITREEWDHVHQIFSRPETILSIRPFEDAVTGTALLSNAGRVHLATSRLVCAEAPTRQWLESYGFVYHTLHFVPHRSKHQRFANVRVAFEDDYDQAAEFATRAIPCVLMRHPWNATRLNIGGITWVDTWPQAVAAILAV